MKKMMLIGGGNIGRGRSEYETKEIDEEIVKMTNKKNPNFLFIGLASNFSDSYYDTIKKIYKNLGCKCSYLKKKNILNNPDIVQNKIKNADIIYIGGGDSIKLITEVKEHKLDKLLENAYEEGKVLVGLSAGAILLSKEGFSDSYIIRGESKKYKFIKGLNLINISFCPHYNEDIEKTNQLVKELKKNPRKIYCLEKGNALKIIDNSIEIIKSIPNTHTYLVNYNNKLIEKEL